jgi:hypothetical protein
MWFVNRSQMKSVMYTLWLVFTGIYFLQGAVTVLFGNGAGGLLMRFGPFRTRPDSCAFWSLVPLGQPQFLFFSVLFLSESKTLA